MRLTNFSIIMTNQALLVTVGENIEEDVQLEIGGFLLTCFANICPYPIEIGRSYMVGLHPYIFDDYSITELEETEEESIIRLGDAFSYLVKGRLTGGRLESAGIVFEDEFLEKEYRYLDGKLVAFKIDRLEAEFL
jgi:hypothetical protein